METALTDAPPAKVLPDRLRLMTSLMDAATLLECDAKASEPEYQKAIEILLRARKVMEKRTDMQSYAVFPFFMPLSPEQSNYLLTILTEFRLFKCHEFLRIPQEAIGEMLEHSDGEPIPYPLALQYLHDAYYHNSPRVKRG